MRFLDSHRCSFLVRAARLRTRQVSQSPLPEIIAAALARNNGSVSEGGNKFPQKCNAPDRTPPTSKIVSYCFTNPKTNDGLAG